MQQLSVELSRVIGTDQTDPVPLPTKLSDVRTRMIPWRFRSVRFSTFRAATTSQEIAFAAVVRWIERIEHRPMLALIGKQGTGKSHLLYSAVHSLMDAWEARDPVGRGAAPLVAPWYRLADELRYGTGTNDSATVRAQLWERKIVLLDEVRPTSGTDFDDTELAKFACHAYDSGSAVLITTNYHPLSDVMGAAAASRFRQVIIDGPDARQS